MGGPFEIRAGNFIVAHVYGGHSRVEDDARLIVAAPKMLDALQAIEKDPYGCRFCDSGKLRNPSKDHDDDCGFLLMRMAIGAATEPTP